MEKTKTKKRTKTTVSKDNVRRFLLSLSGNLLIGLGVSIFKFSQLGNDPYSAMGMGLSEKSGISYGLVLILVSSFIFAFQWFFGKQYIGIGTLINWFLLGYIVEFFIRVSQQLFTQSNNLFFNLCIVVIGVLIISLGIALYQIADVGLSPYDSAALMIHDHLKLPFFWSRILTDGICTLICFFSGGLLGIGTIVCAFGLGPFVHYFTKLINEKWIKEK